MLSVVEVRERKRHHSNTSHWSIMFDSNREHHKDLSGAIIDRWEALEHRYIFPRTSMTNNIHRHLNDDEFLSYNEYAIFEATTTIDKDI